MRVVYSERSSRRHYWPPQGGQYLRHVDSAKWTTLTLLARSTPENPNRAPFMRVSGFGFRG